MKLVVVAEVCPTESVEKVARAVKNIFPISLDCQAISCLASQFRLTPSLGGKIPKLVGKSSEKRSLERFQTLLKSQSIRASARKVFESSVSGSRLSFALNKQAAYAGAVNFCDYSPLGSISVEISNNIGEITDWLAPRDL